jgi:hypothetical protein
MVNRPPKASANEPGQASDPRYEIVFEARSSARDTLSGLVATLKSLGERGGAAIGDAYALAAGSFLNRKEWLEDLNAERRVRRRAQARPPGRTPVSVPAISPTPEDTVATRKASV